MAGHVLIIKFAYLVLTGLFMVNSAHAKEQLTVIFDSGDTLPIEPYLPERVVQHKANPQQRSPLPFQLPITTPSMQPGTVSLTAKDMRYLQQPLFLVGSDQLSKDWLTKKRDSLIVMGAMGLLIEAKDREDIETMQALAEGLRLVPASAEDFAVRLGLTHYPILLSKEGWEQ